MKIIKPDYYDEFSCLMNRCQHTCCANWDVDVDKKTAEYYKSIRGPLGQRLESCIAHSEKGAGFIIGEDGRCPFLNDDNLCDIVIELGEQSLCRTCHYFPRIIRRFSDRVEYGLDPACEEAGRIILSRKGKPAFVTEYDSEDENTCTDEDKEFMTSRESLIKNASTINEECVHAKLSPEFMLSLPGALSVKEKFWTERLFLLVKYKEKIKETAVPDELAAPFEQLLTYFIFNRFYINQDGDDNLQFIIESVGLIKDICRAEVCRKDFCSLPDLIEIVREWSRMLIHSQGKEELIVKELKEQI